MREVALSSVESWNGKLDINEFVSYLESQGKSKNTLEKYVRDMKIFKEYLVVSGVMNADDEVVDITVKTIEEFYNFFRIESLMV